MSWLPRSAGWQRSTAVSDFLTDGRFSKISREMGNADGKYYHRRHVAHLCGGTDVSTVSRAINNHPDINPETKDMIMQVIKDHNYVPNNSARNLKRSEARAIAVLIKGISNPFFNKMIKIFEEEIQKKKYSFVLQHVDERQDEVDVAIQLEKEKRLNGIVFLGGFFSHSRRKAETAFRTVCAKYRWPFG